MESLKRKNFSSGAPLEDKIGYSRAVRVGNMVYISGTTSTNQEGVVEAPGDAYGQSRIICQKIVDALAQAGAKPSEVIRVRIYVTDVKIAQEVAKAYTETFGQFKPASIMVEISGLFRPEHLVEMEAEAIVGSYLE
jgi:enamine deaminase RidA (YjgF/YER057c/UK114 family)